jgi:hypothetical protein
MVAASAGAPRAEPPPQQQLGSQPAEPMLPEGLLELAVAYFSAPERAGRELHLAEAAETLSQQAKSSFAPGLQQQTVKEMLKYHPAFCWSKGHVSLRAAEQPPCATPPPAAAPPVQPPPLPPVAMPPPLPSAPSQTRFPHELVELAISYFMAPERVGRDQNRKEAVHAIWQRSKSLAGEKQPCALVKQMLNQHPAFVCAVGRVSLQGAGAGQAPVAPLEPAAAPVMQPPPLPRSQSATFVDPARDLRREEEVLIDRLVAFFRAKAATSLPLNSVAGSCQLTPLLRDKYGTLHVFLTDPASARGGACFRVDGTNVLLKPAASMVEPALAEAAYIAEVVRQLRFEPAGELSVPVICSRCLLPAALKPRGTLAVLAAHRDALEMFRPFPNGNYYVRLAQLHAAATLPVVGAALVPESVVAAEHARHKRSRSRSSSRSRSCSPPGKRAVVDRGHNANLRREEELLVGRVVAYFHAKESMSLPFHSVAGACQLTPLLRRKYATLRAFLVDPANARSGARFRVEGENLLFPRHCIEAAYIADVVRQLRFAPAGELSLPVLGERCPLPAVLMPPGCLAVLLAHREVLQVYRPSKRGSHIVRLAQRAETTLPVVGAAVAHDAAVVAEEHARRKRSRRGSRSRSCSPPSKRAAEDAPDLRRLLPPGRHV